MRNFHDAPLISIVIVAFNSHQWLQRQVNALLHQTETRFEVVYWSNSPRPSDFHDSAIPESWKVFWSEENLGFAAGCNRAVALTSSPLIAFLNPDAFPFPNWIERILTAIAKFPNYAAFGSTQWRADCAGILDGIGDVVHFSGFAYRAGFGQKLTPPPTGESFAACGAALVVRKSAFDDVDGFDERFFCYFEDVDLCFRLRLAGHRILQVCEAEVDHVGGGTLGRSSPFSDFHGARNRLWTFVKCMPAPLLFLGLPFHIGFTIAIVMIHGLSSRGWWTLMGVLAGMRGLGPVLAQRRNVQSTRKASLHEIARSLSWSVFALLIRFPARHRSAIRLPSIQ